MQNRVPPYSIRANLLPALKGEAWHFVIKASQFALAEFINEYRKDVERLKQALHTLDDSLYVLLNGIAKGYEPVALIIN